MTSALADLLERWLTTGRERHIARYELFMEAMRRPDLAAVLHRGGMTVRQRVADVLTSLGANVAASVDRAELPVIAQRLTNGALAP